MLQPPVAITFLEEIKLTRLRLPQEGTRRHGEVDRKLGHEPHPTPASMATFRPASAPRAPWGHLAPLGDAARLHLPETVSCFEY